MPDWAAARASERCWRQRGMREMVVGKVMLRAEKKKLFTHASEMHKSSRTLTDLIAYGN